ncbi:hypothetical protein [Kaarinaea lacus]
MLSTQLSTVFIFSHKVLSSQPGMIVAVIMTVVLYGCDKDIKTGKDAITFYDSSFQSPVDGKLSEEQVADYIVIRQKILRQVNAQKLAKKTTSEEIPEISPISSNNRYFDQIERQVAHSKNMSYDEFQWIKDTVISTQTTLVVQQYYDLNNRIMTLLDKTLVRYKEINSENTDQQEQLVMAGHVEEMKQEIANLRGKLSDQRERSPALEHNMMIVSRFKKEFESLEQQAIQTLSPKPSFK